MSTTVSRAARRSLRLSLFAPRATAAGITGGTGGCAQGLGGPVEEKATGSATAEGGSVEDGQRKDDGKGLAQQ